MIRLLFLFILIFNITAAGLDLSESSKKDSDPITVPKIKEKYIPRVYEKDCKKAIETYGRCKTDSTSTIGATPINIYFTGMIGAVREISQNIKNEEKLPTVKYGQDVCEKCIKTKKEEIKTPSKIEQAKMIKALQAEVFAMMEEEILNRAEIILEDDYVLKLKKSSCDWIKEDLREKAKGYIDEEKINTMFARMGKPGELKVHKCSESEGGQYITLDQYRSKSKVADPKSKKAATDIVMALSYISKSTLNFLVNDSVIFSKKNASASAGSGAGGNNNKRQLSGNSSSLDFIEFFSNENNYRKLEDMVSNKSGEKFEELQNFLKYFKKQKNQSLRDNLRKSLEEEPTMRYLLAQDMNDFQRRFKEKLCIFGKCANKLEKQRKKLLKNPYKFFHKNITLGEGKLSEVPRFVETGQSKFCDKVEEDLDRFKELKNLFEPKGKPARNLFKFSNGVYKVDSSAVTLIKDKNPENKKIVDNLYAILSASLDKYVSGNKDRKNDIDILALSKCSTRNDYGNMLSSDMPFATNAQPNINKSVSLINNENEENRYTQWAKSYCENRKRGDKLAQGYQSNQQSWASAHCSLRSCDLEPISTTQSDRTGIADVGPSAVNTPTFRDDSRRNNDLNEYRTYQTTSRDNKSRRISNLENKVSSSPKVLARSSSSTTSPVSHSNETERINELKQQIAQLESDYKKRKNEIDTNLSRDDNRASHSFLDHNQNRFSSGNNSNRSIASNDNNQGSSYINKSDANLRDIASQALSSVHPTEKDILMNNVLGHLDEFKNGIISLDIKTNLSNEYSVIDVLKEITPIDKAKIKELIKAGLPVKMIDKNGHEWIAEKDTARYNELRDLINKESLEKIDSSSNQNLELNEKRGMYLLLIEQSSKVIQKR